MTPVLGRRRIANYLRVLTLETQAVARACAKSHVHVKRFGDQPITSEDGRAR